jgi:hypothetical protein
MQKMMFKLIWETIARKSWKKTPKMI